MALSEKYAAMLNKNLEDTSNLAKTLKTTQTHLYDKLRQSHQNATQFINRDDYQSLNSQGISPAQGSTKNQMNRFAPLSTADKLKLDYRGAPSEYQSNPQHQGLFLNFSSTPQNSNPYTANIQNQRYSSTKGGSKQST